jgi:D-lactate dehydrogenase
MALLYFYDSTPLDKLQLTASLEGTDHHWEFCDEKIALDNLHPDTEVISVFVTSSVTRDIIEKLPRLRLIACRSTGFNNVDLKAAEERDIAVVNVPTYGEATVAEYAFTLLLALTRKLPLVLSNGTEPQDQTNLTGVDLRGKTMGIVGTGHIGQKAIAIARGFDMKVIAYDPYPKQQLADSLDFHYVDKLDDLFEQADFISLHAPFTPTTLHLVNEKTLARMKPTAYLVNTARGELIDTKALIDALESNKLAGAALDVVEGEALLNHHEEIAVLRSGDLPAALLKHSIEISILKKLPNVIISPHNAFNTTEAVGRINQTTAQNIIDYWYGHTPNRIVAGPPKNGKLVVVRHTESEWNATGQWTGRTDVHLSEKGFHEAALLGLNLRSLNLPIDQAYCSEQIRTRETLEGMLNSAQMFDVPIHREANMNERDYGEYTGKNKWEMKELLGEDAFNNLRRGWDYPVPGGETLKQVYERVLPFYRETVLPQLQQGKNILIVAHGNSIRALMKYIESISNNDVESLEMLFGDILVYDIDNDGKIVSKQHLKIDSPPPNA